MNNILSLLLIIVILFSCSNNQTKESNSTEELNNSSSIDPRLYGIWKDDILNQYYRSYSSNGKFVYWQTSDISSFKFIKECGSWWLQDGVLFEKYYNFTLQKWILNKCTFL